MSEINNGSQSIKQLIESTIKRLYEANNSVLAIATKTGLSEREVRRIVRQLGIQKPSITNELIQGVKSRIKAGMSGLEIAEELDMPMKRVHYIAYEKLGLSLARRTPSTDSASKAIPKIHYTAPEPQSGQLIPNYQTETIEVAI